MVHLLAIQGTSISLKESLPAWDRPSLAFHGNPFPIRYSFVLPGRLHEEKANFRSKDALLSDTASKEQDEDSVVIF